MIGLSWMALAGGALAVGGVAAGALLTSAEEQPKARKEPRPFSCTIRALSPGERARHNEIIGRINGEGAQRVNLFGDFHRADLC